MTEKRMERDQEEWDVLRHARWYVQAYKPITRTIATEKAELLAKIDALLQPKEQQKSGGRA